MAENNQECLQRILQKAIRRREQFNDRKDFCSVDDILVLLDAGAEVCHLNAVHDGRGYVHQVRYEGLLFVSASDAPVRAFTQYHLSRN